ncbi:MAG: type II CRISPR RNA-guided endonuclease Cas9 [Candidatus Acidiferrales bacterium]
MDQTAEVAEYTLGLDLGSASIGWALIALDSSHNPRSLLRAGVRIFEPGVEGSMSEIERGKDQSKAIDRRNARLHRRQLRRRAARQRDLFLLLQHKSLLPPAADPSANLSDQRHQVLNDLDRALTADLRRTVEAASLRAVEQSLPYYLRKSALDRKLTAFELGRVFYHLIQRRGFKSNRREGKKAKDDDVGKVKAGISELEALMASTGARTLGGYFADLNSHERRIRGRWTARIMYEREFELIWQSQRAYSPDLLDDDLKAQISRLLFFQRPIAAQEHLIGFCELEPEERRTPWAFLEAQRFRALQKVNDLRVIERGALAERPLTNDERNAVFAKLEDDGDQSFAKLRTLLGLKKAEFNLERGGGKRLRGNRTNLFMRSVFGVFWDEMPEEEKHQAVTLWYRTESEEKLAQKARERWALDEIAANKFAAEQPEDGYCSLSLKALRRLLPEMAKGVSYGEIRPQLYPETRREPKDLLPLVREAVPSLRNPAVERALTEVRKLVNAIVRQYGKPYEIRVEMARELRKSRKEREEATLRNRTRQREREEAKAKILKDCGVQNPSRSDLEKALLFEECGGTCPYTGRTIEFSSLFGNSQFDIEHIIPVSRCPDDSFLNKTLCYHEENRSVKGGRTPWQAYGADEERWTQILARVGKFGNRAKLRRFELRSEEELGEFTERQMNDTRYTTRLAVDLLSALYGGRDIPRGDDTNRRAIHATTGMVTATLRKSWGLEAILREASPSSNGESRGKPRTDHRHHAVDAIVIALTSQSTIQRMSETAARATLWQSGSRPFRGLEAPWPNFVDSIRPHIESMVASHRPEHKMSGALHKDTIYGRPYLFQGRSVVNLRRSVHGITLDQIAEIPDVAVRQAVETKLAEQSGDSTKFNPDDPTTLPSLATNGAVRIPIRKVRIRETKKALLELPGNRFVQSDEVHHFELFVQREGRKEIWTHYPVTLMEAYFRRRRGLPVISRKLEDDPGAQFLFSLMKGDMVEMDYNGQRGIFRVKKFYSAGSIWFAHANNAQPDKDQQRDGTKWSKAPDALRKLQPRKVVVDLLGRMHPAND